MTSNDITSLTTFVSNVILAFTVFSNQICSGTSKSVTLFFLFSCLHLLQMVPANSDERYGLWKPRKCFQRGAKVRTSCQSLWPYCCGLFQFELFDF